MKWLVLSCLCIAGCVSNNALQYESVAHNNLYHIARVRKGMSEKEVLWIMHKPYSYESFQVGDDIYDVWFYVTKPTGISQSRMVPQNLTPLTFQNGILVGTGYSWYYYAMKAQADEMAAQQPAQEKPKSQEVEDKEFEKVLRPNPEAKPTPKPKEAGIITSHNATVKKAPASPPSFIRPWNPIVGAKKIEISKVQIGMTEAEVTTLLGTPTSIETYNSNDDLYDIWFYEIASSKKRIPLTFKNGVLIGKTRQVYQQARKQADPDQINGYDRPAERKQEEESEQDFDYW